MEQDWQILAISHDVVGIEKGLMVLEWKLNQRPDPEWQQFLISSGAPKSGSLTFIALDPRVVGDRLRYPVPEGDLEAAVKWVEASIPLANQKFEANVLSKRRRRVAEEQATRDADERRLQEARERINRSD